MQTRQQCQMIDTCFYNIGGGDDAFRRMVENEVCVRMLQDAGVQRRALMLQDAGVQRRALILVISS
jgi:hypothetical protein